MKKIQLFLLLVFFASQLNAQIGSDNKTLNGIIYGSGAKDKETLEGAVIRWIHTKKGTVTDDKGKFSLSSDGITDKRIIVFYVGYNKDTVDVEGKDYVEVLLKGSFTTQQIVVESEVKSSFIDNSDKKTEIITQTELKKDACCDLSGCFGKNASVDVAVTDILTNTKELKVLGLEGSYTQVLVDNMPIMSGLVTKFGVTSLPGTLINKIMISKGSNSVMQGYESISGIMNVLLKDFATSDRFLLNGFMNSILEKQVNLNGTAKMKNWSTLASFQTVQESRRVDRNNDSFLDAPLTTRYMFYNKWKYGLKEDDKTNLTFAVKYLDEKRIGGQTNFNYDKDLGSNTVYGQTVNLQNGDLYARWGQKIGEASQMKIFASGSFFNQESYYGITKYNAKQRDGYVNALFEFPVFDKSYLRFGTSYKYQKIDEDIKFLQPSDKTYAGSYEKYESIPGVFTEASFEFPKLNTAIIGGLRLDFHNKDNTITTPRLLVRHQLTKNTVIRASIGTGFRTVNLFSENANMLASGRNIIVPEELKPEKMVNYGVDVLQYITLGALSGNVNFDFYRTEFSNKVVQNYAMNPMAVTIINHGDAASNVFQVESNLTFFNNLDFKLAYKYIDLYHWHNGVKMEQEFNSKHRVLSSLSYSPRDRNWNVNFTMQWFGKQVLPTTKDYPAEFQRPSESDPYAVVNGQFSKNFRHFELYVGVENLFDFTQTNPIIDPQNPFSKYFDTSYIWGPTNGRTFYLGFRMLFDTL
ncbi:MAG: TonB-dependent receptor [Bacteroidetes bacterium]|nr:TonB-dependent receptor [Bacteroidota bacterium]